MMIEIVNYVIEVLKDYRSSTDHYRQEGEDYTALDETIDELIEEYDEKWREWNECNEIRISDCSLD